MASVGLASERFPPVRREVPPGAPAPVLTRVEATTEGYALLGSGFGADRATIQVFAGSN